MFPRTPLSLIAALGAATLLAGGTLGSSPAQAADEVAKLPEGHIGIHYYRPDGKYDSWGLHTWESHEKVEGNKVVGPKSKGDMPVGTITWMTPMKASGTDGFGAYWHIKANEYRNGKVNYIIHKGDTKDQCGKDMHWFIPQGSEIFVNSGDCNIYFSKDEALKARK